MRSHQRRRLLRGHHVRIGALEPRRGKRGNLISSYLLITYSPSWSTRQRRRRTAICPGSLRRGIAHVVGNVTMWAKGGGRAPRRMCVCPVWYVELVSYPLPGVRWGPWARRMANVVFGKGGARSLARSFFHAWFGLERGWTIRLRMAANAFGWRSGLIARFGALA